MAYYSSSGAMIRSGAAGLGEYFGAGPGDVAPPVTSFQDGVFSSGHADVWTTDNGDDPGPLMAYQDGSLGECSGCGLGQYDQAAAGIGYPLYIDGKPVDRPVNIMHAPTPMGSAPLMAYRDGVLGEYFSGEAPAAHAFRAGVLGAVDSKVLDMTDPEVVKEVKSALGLAMPEVSMSPESLAAGKYGQGWYTDPIWDADAGAMWTAFTQKAEASTGGKVTASSLTKKGKYPYPSALGIGTMLAMGVGSPGYGSDPTYFQKNFPILHAYQASMVAAGGPEGFSVQEPFFTISEKVSGKGMFAGVSKGALIGVGAAVAIGAYLVFRKK